MYQRTYTDAYAVPENYRGIAVDQVREKEEEQTPPEVQAVHGEPFYECECECESEPDCEVRKRRREHPILLRMEDFIHKLPFHFPRFEGEDFLLIGAALLLLFSKSGDKECALILLALLFIG